MTTFHCSSLALPLWLKYNSRLFLPSVKWIHFNVKISVKFEYDYMISQTLFNMNHSGYLSHHRVEKRMSYTHAHWPVPPWSPSRVFRAHQQGGWRWVHQCSSEKHIHPLRFGLVKWKALTHLQPWAWWWRCRDFPRRWQRWAQGATGGTHEGDSCPGHWWSQTAWGRTFPMMTWTC